jgi:hypothetical protein
MATEKAPAIQRLKNGVEPQWELRPFVAVQWELPGVLPRSVQRSAFARPLGTRTSAHSSALR